MGKASRRKKERQAASEADIQVGTQDENPQSFHYIRLGGKPWCLRLTEDKEALLLFSTSEKVRSFMEDVGINAQVASYPGTTFKHEAAKFVKRGVTTALVDRSAFGGDCAVIDLQTLLVTPGSSDGDLTRELRSMRPTGLGAALAGDEDHTPILMLKVPRWWLERAMITTRGCFGLIDLDTEAENAFAGIQMINQYGWPRASVVVDAGDGWGESQPQVHEALLVFGEALREAEGKGVVLFQPSDEGPPLQETIPLDIVGIDKEIIGQQSVFSQALEVVWEAEREGNKEILIAHLPEDQQKEAQALLFEAPLAFAITNLQQKSQA